MTGDFQVASTFSPLGRVMLVMCDTSMSIDIDKVAMAFPNLSKRQLVVIALHLGLSVKGGS